MTTYTNRTGGGPIVVTAHARDRYRERIRPGADDREAREVLRDAVDRAVKTGQRTAQGDLYWTVDRPDMVLVTRHDPDVGAVLVTVLHPDEMRGADALAGALGQWVDDGGPDRAEGSDGL